ncbi:D-glycero-D-manno-heptose 1-phosphate guanosyltransferase [Marinobacterium nitratireducens]|uniref:D-glycero-D-manno-heptose 1-phosphate guanosyltransferase n=1 Tax=Marinobacterium nitratireducens TaxID=518897 RepID=A0A918DQV3_9GAMM|nr:GGDEF domain-containing protein [Marinobacterium nitratireducens]GGO78610.1 D-glycero-D-manno-heptose 1-phosphate guanosyltransferase [Marinobacterium nitratireducens]
MQATLRAEPAPNLTSLLDQVIRNESLTPVFQPVVDIQSGEVIGHEALIRGPVNTPLHMPGPLFQTAMGAGRLSELELLCRRLALQRFAELNPAGKLFINVNASLLGLPGHPQGLTREWLEELDIPQERIVIELSEEHPFDHSGITRAAVQHYREMGFWIAIDDLGSGYSGLRLWSELEPAYVKIDRHFVQGVDRDSVKREFVKSIINIGNSTGCRIVAEGIETQGELHTLQLLGVRYGQGFLLGKPEALPVAAGACRHIAMQPLDRTPGRQHTETASVLLRQAPAVALDDPIAAAAELLRQHPDLSVLPVLEDGQPVGVIRRNQLWELYSTPYGRALYDHKPVTRLLCTDFLAVDQTMPLEEVSRRLTGRDSQDLQQDILITQDGGYLGMGHLRDLLRSITELKIRSARQANPLTQLPGNVPVKDELDRLLEGTCDIHVAYIDLNNFKAYNDRYGYARGDQVIRQLGDMIDRHAGGPESFVGHIGGDDFVVIFRHALWREICERIVEVFEHSVSEFYNPEHLEAGGIHALDRQGKRQFHGLLSVSVGVVHPDPYRCSSSQEVAELAAGARKAAKGSLGPVYLSARRAL